MRLFKPKYKDKNGKAKQVEKWWLEFRDPNGIVQRWGLSTTDQDVADITKSQISSLNEWSKKGLDPPDDLVKWVRRQDVKLRKKIYEVGLLKAEQANCTKTLAEHLKDYITDLQIDSKSSYPAQVESHIRKVITGCGIEFWSDVDGTKIRKFLIDEGIGNHTAQHYIKHFKMFANWLKEQGRIKEVPVLKSIKYSVAPQRAFEENELQALYEAARNGPEIYGLSGHERYVLYKLAFDSGLRRDELRSLTRASFDFKKCTVLVPGTDTKNDNEAYQKITPETAALVRDFVRDKMLDTKLFEINNYSAEMIREDCEAAGIETTNWKGIIKFHSLRHSLASHLANEGVPPHVVQKIMRHADISTTMRYYTHLLRGAEDNAIDKLRGVGEKHTKQKLA